MSDPQPWRNPRPAPQLNDVQPRIGQFLIHEWLRVWWPALLWAAVIFVMSTDSFSSDRTKWFFEPAIHWMFPSLTARQIERVHHYIRKSAHFTEYFIFCTLLFRGIRGTARGWRWTWGVSALLIAAGYSVLDEIHQAFVTSRIASPYDSLLDSVGALAAFLALWLWFRYLRTSQSNGV